MEKFSDFSRNNPLVQKEVLRAVKDWENKEVSTLYSNDNGEPILVGQDPRDIDDVFEYEIARMLQRLAQHFGKSEGADEDTMEEHFGVEDTAFVAEMRESVMNAISDYCNMHFEYVSTEF